MPDNIKEQLLRVTNIFTFDMAHALNGYDGPCKNIHGHTYHLSVTIKGNIIHDIGNSKNGMVLDFTDLKVIDVDVLKTYIFDAGLIDAQLNVK